MAYTTRIDPDAGRFSGSLTGEEVREAMRALFEDERWRPGFEVIWDGRSVSSYEIDPDDIALTASVTEHLRERMGTGRAAVIMEGFEAYTSAFMMRLENRADSARLVELFGSAEEALAWLGIRGRPAILEDVPSPPEE